MIYIHILHNNFVRERFKKFKEKKKDKRTNE